MEGQAQGLARVHGAPVELEADQGDLVGEVDEDRVGQAVFVPAGQERDITDGPGIAGPGRQPRPAVVVVQADVDTQASRRRRGIGNPHRVRVGNDDARRPLAGGVVPGGRVAVALRLEDAELVCQVHEHAVIAGDGAEGLPEELDCQRVTWPQALFANVVAHEADLAAVVNAGGVRQLYGQGQRLWHGECWRDPEPGRHGRQDEQAGGKEAGDDGARSRRNPGEQAGGEQDAGGADGGEQESPLGIAHLGPLDEREQHDEQPGDQQGHLGPAVV